MHVIDYNGSGRWSREEIIARYGEYVRRFRVREPRNLTPVTSQQGDKNWVYPIMEQVIEGIVAEDLACAEIGVEFIEANDSFPFGLTLKSQTARALRRMANISPEQQDRVRRRIAAMLVAEYLPREFRQYAKLGRRLGMAETLLEMRDALNFRNPWVSHYFEYFTAQAQGD